MKKKFLSILTFLIIIALAAALVACSDYTPGEDNDDETSKRSFTHTVKNGTFYDAKSTTDEKNIFDTVSGWTANAGSIASATTGNKSNGVLTSAISLSDKDIFEDIADNYFTISVDNEGKDLDEPKTMPYPGLDGKIPQVYPLDKDGNEDKEANKIDEDKNVLAIASVKSEESVYFKSSSITLAKNSIYLFQVSVNTMIDADVSNRNRGAWVIIKGDTTYSIRNINTEGQWKTYYLFIETNKKADMSITVELWLGYGPSHSTSEAYEKDGKDLYPTRGVALFDNVLCEKVDAANLTTAVVEGEKAMTLDAEYSYDEAKTAHENYTLFMNALKPVSDKHNTNFVGARTSYYFLNATMENRTHLSTSRFSGSGTDRKYFNSFREYYQSNNLSGWSISTIGGTKSNNTRYYGSVDLTKLYDIAKEGEDTTKIADLYNKDIGKNYKMTLPTYDEWHKLVYTNADNPVGKLGESFVTMLYNNDLRTTKLKSSNTLTIEAGKYYEVNVWAYVWAKEYTHSDGTSHYYPEYDGTAPEDPAATASVSEKYLYEAAKNANKPLGERYFSELSVAEKDLISNFDPKNSLGEFATVSDSMKPYLVSWVKTVVLGLDESDPTDVNDVINDYYFAFVNAEFEKEDAGEANILTENMKALKDEFNRAYLQERQDNYNTYNKYAKKVKEYEEEKDSYQIKLNEYNQKYNAWEEANKNRSPVYATVKLTGAGDGIEGTTTKIGEWQKITLKVKGNQLSSRSVTLELCLGNGEETEYDKHMLGLAFFDNVTVEEFTSVNNDDEYTPLSEYKAEGEINFGGLYGTGKELTADEAKQILKDNWEEVIAEGVSPNDAGKLDLKVSADEDVKEITINDNKYQLYVLSYTHKEATASTLKYKGADPIEIKANKFYRIAFVVKTEDIDESLGISFTLKYGKDKDNLDATLDSSVTKYVNNTDAWAEVVYYVSGDLIDTYYIGIEVAMGSGNRFDTSKYVKGTVRLSTFNFLEIDYTEYSNASTGDKIVKNLSLNKREYELDKSDKKLTNGTYSKIDYKSTDSDEFDENGALTGIGATSNWTIGTSVSSNGYEAPTGIQLNGTTLKWKGSVGYSNTEKGGSIAEVRPIGYEIWAKYTEDNKTVTKLFGYKVATSENTDYDYDVSHGEDVEKWRMCSFAVKAVGNYGISDLSTYTATTVGKFTGTVTPVAKLDGHKKYAAQAGTILVENDEKVTNATGHETAYPTMMKVTSPYFASKSATSSSVSLSASSYYKISVWMLTVDDAQGSVTIADASGSLQAETDSSNLGFINQDTAGVWKKYAIFVKTGTFSASMKVRLSLGDPYAKKESGQADGKTKNYYDIGNLSTGSVYFDAVRITEITETEYITAKDADDNKGESSYAELDPDLLETEKYSIYVMQYAIDSFDAWDGNEDSKTLGRTPTTYKWGYDSDGGLKSDSDLATYGIYEADTRSENMESAVKNIYYYENSDKKETPAFNNIFKDNFGKDYDFSNYSADQWDEFIKKFLKITRNDGYEGGNNVLVMSNKAESGYAQHYTLNSTYKGTLPAGSYAKVSVTAKTAIMKVTKKVESNPDDSTDTTTKYEYSKDDAFAEFRVVTGEKNVSKKMNSALFAADDAESPFDAVTYKVYISNPSDESKEITWAFYLGDELEEASKATEFNAYLVGMMALDIVSYETIDKEEYDAAKTAAGKTDEFYEYKVTDDNDDDNDDDNNDDNKDEEKESVWSKIVNNEYFWLYISSFVIAVAIIITIAVVLVKRWKKKHPKPIAGENVVKTTKDIVVAPTVENKKEEADEDIDEYTDDAPKKIQTVQRVVNKGKKKKK